MEQPEIPNPIENQEKPYNPNTIGELISLGDKLPTSPDKVYRSVRDKKAIEDLYSSGVVRNKFSAGLMPENRWKDRVFWSKGREGGFHTVFENQYVLEAPIDIVNEREVTKDDVTAIYTEKDGKVINILESQSKDKDFDDGKKIEELEAVDKQTIEDVRNKLGI